MKSILRTVAVLLIVCIFCVGVYEIGIFILKHLGLNLGRKDWIMIGMGTALAIAVLIIASLLRAAGTGVGIITDSFLNRKNG